MEQKNRTDGKNSSLNDARLGRLERIGFRWAKRKGQASWDEKFVSVSYTSWPLNVYNTFEHSLYTRRILTHL